MRGGRRDGGVGSGPLAIFVVSFLRFDVLGDVVLSSFLVRIEGSIFPGSDGGEHLRGQCCV